MDFGDISYLKSPLQYFGGGLLFLKLKRSSLAHSNEQKKLRQISYVHVTFNQVLARLELILWLKKWFLGSQDAHSDGFLRFFLHISDFP